MALDLSSKDSVSAEIRAELGRQRKPQAFLAEVLDLSQVQVSARLRGEVEWRVSEVGAVAQALGVPVSQLIRDAA
jgi:transcriptional regulator with XRE-family HTH domain